MILLSAQPGVGCTPTLADGNHAEHQQYRLQTSGPGHTYLKMKKTKHLHYTLSAQL